jgi:putative addiction module component (TIGR02574 family)
MAASDIDPETLTIEQRLDLIDKLRLSIVVDARRGDKRAQEVMDLDRPLEPEVLTELHRRAEALKRDPSRGIPWEQLNEKLRKKYG